MDAVLEPRPSPQKSKRTRRPSPRRGRYVSKACVDCRRRKIKCSGENPCQGCHLESLDCLYVAGPARVRKKPPKAICKADPSTPSEGPPSAPNGSLFASNSTGSTYSDLSPGRQDEFLLSFPPDIGTNRPFSHPIPHLDEIPMKSCNIDIHRWNIQAKLIEVQRMRTMVAHYVVKVNPRIPCLNREQLHHDVEALLAGRTPASDHLQMVALVDLIIALIQVMTNETVDTDNLHPAGWKEFQHAERLLARAAWNRASNLRTIQCLILKTMYLIYADREELAYDTVSTMTRICFQLGLHKQDRWGDCSPFETHLRQRIFWTVFCLERHVAESCRLPYLIRQSDLDVAIPRHIDDTKLQASLDVLPPEDPDAPIQHLKFSCHRAIIFTEAWDRLLGLRAGNGSGSDAAIVAAIDARVDALRAELPVNLRWRPECLPKAGYVDALQRFRVRESLLLHLLLNRIRLVVRSPWIKGETCPDIIRRQCLEIATDTIRSIQKYYETTLPDPIERHVNVRYLLDSLHPLGQLVLHESGPMTWTTRQAREMFDVGLSLLKSFASHLTLARTALDGIQGTVVRMAQKTEEALLTGSLEDCFQWIDFLGMDNGAGAELDEVERGGDLGGQLLDDIGMGVDDDPARWVHTDSWLMQ